MTKTLILYICILARCVVILNSPRCGYLITIQTLMVISINNALIIQQIMTRLYLLYRSIELLCTRGKFIQGDIDSLE